MTPQGFVLEYPYVAADRLRLQIDSVGKTYGSRQVLRSVCADLTHGDTLVITGRNGAGKSTLLRIIAGLVRPSRGAVHLWIDGAPIEGEQRRHVLGFVGPDIHLYRELTAREHLRLVARLRGLHVDGGAGAAVLEAVGLRGREDDRVGEYSSGMLQRLRYGLALMHRPSLLLLDEPTTNLDAAGISLVGDIIAAHEGIVVIATNDPRDEGYGELVLPLDMANDG